jgi:hypothetical protein
MPCSDIDGSLHSFSLARFADGFDRSERRLLDVHSI